ncbi:MAG: hypothetical protein SGI72_15830 [Planctomycetota bacterium]|nr:hypothetical protein [Planctomycetota bacterium]
MNPETLSVAVLTSELFDSLGIPHVLGGSLVSTYYSEPRFTNDADFAVALRSNQVDALVARASEHFFVDRSFVLEAVQAKRMFTMVHRKPIVKVDVYVRERTGFFASQLERARLAPLRKSPPGSAWIVSHEDIVLQKLLWFEQGGRASEQQWRDVLGVLRIWHGRLDEAYLNEWADKLDLVELLDRARRETVIG